MNRPDLIQRARLTGTLSEEAEKMIEELADFVTYKNDRKNSRKLRALRARYERKHSSKANGDD